MIVVKSEVSRVEMASSSPCAGMKSSTSASVATCLVTRNMDGEIGYGDTTTI